MMVLRHSLSEKIKTAFEDTVYPGDDNIGRDEIKDFIGKNWREIPIEQIRANRFDLPMFSPKGFSYYLPAFLLATLLNSYEGDTLPDSLVWMLAPPIPGDDWRSWFFEMVSYLNQVQKTVIYEFLSNYKQLEPQGNWSALSSSLTRLESATTFWRNEIT